MNFRTTSLFVLLPCLAACGGDNSIGKDACLGDTTRCEVPELSEQTSSPEERGLHTSALQTLSPKKSRVLSFPSPYFDDQGFPAFGELAGSADGTLWHIRPSEDGRALEAHILSADGDVLETAAISADDAIGAAPGANVGALTDLGNLRADFRWTSVVAQSGAAPVVLPEWSDCESDGAGKPIGCTGIVGNAIAFQRDVTETPVRLSFPDRFKDSSSVLFSQTTDGAIWVFRNRILEKYDADGSLLAQQDAVQASYATTHTRLHSTTNVPSLLALPGGGVSLISISAEELEADENAELWIFDADANPSHRIRLDATSYLAPFAMALDDGGSLTVFAATQNGDLSLARFDVVTGDPQARDVLMREDYTSLRPSSVTRDVAGNVYFLLSTGGRYEPVPTLCSAAVDGGIRCFLVPELTSRTIVGAEAGVVYSEATPDIGNFVGGKDTAPREVVLQRFEVPMDADTLPVFEPDEL